MPKIIRFLGYNPLPEAENLAAKLTRYRLARGIAQEALAKTLGVDKCTLGRWERGDTAPGGVYHKIVEKLLSSDPLEFQTTRPDSSDLVR